MRLPVESAMSVVVGIWLLSGCGLGGDVHVSNVGSALSGNVHSIVAISEGETTLVVGNEDFTVETRPAGGVWQPVSDLTVQRSGPTIIDTVVVADNSGSEDGYLVDIAAAVSSFSHRILVRAHDDRVGLVRVSTGAWVLRELSTEESDLQAGVAEMFVANGWTALWDGARLANEVLERGAQEMSGSERCIDMASRSIVLFTDGADNNSADERSSLYSDGIATTQSDVEALAVNGIGTAVHVVEVGHDIEESDLRQVADATGGLYRNIRTYGALVGALHSAADRLENGVPMCFVPAGCGHTEARVTIEFADGETLVREFSIPESCAVGQP